MAAIAAIVPPALLAISLTGGGSPLAEAAGRIEGESMRVALAMNGTDADGPYAIAGDGSWTADSLKGTMDATFEQGGENIAMELRNVGDEFWIRFPGRRRELMPAGKEWLHSVDSTVAPQTLTPSEFARFLADADEVDEVGDGEFVRGQATTRYRGRVDVLEIADEVGGETERRYERMFGGHDIEIAVEAWVSGEGLPVRMQIAVEAGGESVEAKVDFLEFGVPVDVRVPPEARIIEEREWDAFLEGGASS